MVKENALNVLFGEGLVGESIENITATAKNEEDKKKYDVPFMFRVSTIDVDQ